jgi:hypothetical protein
MCVSMSDKPFDAEACNIGGHASATNGLSDMKTHIENTPCNRPLKKIGQFVNPIHVTLSRHWDTSVFPFIGPSDDGRRHGRGTYLFLTLDPLIPTTPRMFRPDMFR